MCEHPEAELQGRRHRNETGCDEDGGVGLYIEIIGEGSPSSCLRFVFTSRLFVVVGS